MSEDATGAASTGDDVLDGMLRGGIPRDRAVLFAGGPGSGKSTLAMQFLQAGLDGGERGLFVSTEQTFEELRDGRVRVAPARRSQPPALKTHHHTPIGIPGLDALCGGGLATGGGVLLRHDGYANLTALFGALFDAAVERGFVVVLVPTIRLRPSGVERLLAERGHDLQRLLDDDRLFVLDPIGAWDEGRENVFGARETAAGVIGVLDEIDDHAGDDRTFALVNADAMVNTLGPDDAREVRYHQESRLLGEEEMLVHVSNPDVADERSAQFYVNTAEQVIETWVTDDGLQYVSLDKSPCGFVGTTSLVEYATEPPFVEIQQPPHDRENPYARDPDPDADAK